MISIVYKDEQTIVYGVDTKDIFKTYPVKDVILKNAQLASGQLDITANDGSTTFDNKIIKTFMTVKGSVADATPKYKLGGLNDNGIYQIKFDDNALQSP